MKSKIIQINTSSLSFTQKDYEKYLYDSWYARVAFQLKKRNSKLDIECWTVEKNAEKEEIREKNGIKFRIFPTSISVRNGMEISTSMLKALKEEQKKEKSLILHFHEYHSWQTYLMLAVSKKSKSKIIVQHHGGRSPLKNLTKYKRLFLGLPVILAMQACENTLFKKIDIVYALSDEEIDYIKSKTDSEVKFRTMGIEEEYFNHAEKNKARKALGFEQNEKYALYLGRIKTTKGISELLDAFRKIDAKLLIVGDGPDYNKYKDYASDMENVKFKGAIMGREKLLYLSACDCLILPSYTEGAPVVVMEAVASNLPVVATDVGGVRKMIVNGREGIVIKPKSSEEIITAVNKILSWKKKNIRQYADKYKWEKIIRETIKDYNKLENES